MVYDVDGYYKSIVYGFDGIAKNLVYDVSGNAISLIPFFDSAVISNVFTSSITSQPQGGCIDDDGNVYVCFYDAGKFLKHNIGTGTDTEVSFAPNAYGHANGMTYNPNTGYLYLASINNTGEVYVFDTTFNLVDTLYARDSNGNIITCYNIAYDRKRRRFISMSSGYMKFYDDNYDFVKQETYNVSDWQETGQDIETDGTFVYEMAYNPNKIVAFDMKGNAVKQISCTNFSGEPESMCYDWINDVYYIEGKSTYYVIKSVVFM